MRNDHKVALTVAIYRSGQLVERRTLRHDIIKLGRDASCHLRLDHQEVARMHAVIELQSLEEATLIDLGNSTPTVVNGGAVNKCQLRAGDRIVVGVFEVVVESLEVSLAERVAVALPLDPDWVSFANPFAVPALSVFSAAGEGSYEYQPVAAVQPLPTDAFDSIADEIEVRIKWGRNLLHVAHIPHNGSFTIGERDAGEMVDFVVPESQLGRGHLKLVLSGGRVVLADAQATIQLPEGTSMTVPQALAGRLAEVGEENVPVMPLAHGGAVLLKLGELEVELRGVKGGKKAAVPFSLSRLASGAVPHIAASLIAAVGLLGVMSVLSPPLNASSDDSISEDQRYLIQMTLDAAAERERDEPDAPELADAGDLNQAEGGQGTAAKNEAGKMGSQTSTATNRRWGAQGDAKNPVLARRAALQDAAAFGMIGLLGSADGGDPNAPTVPWGADYTLGADDASGNGNMWGESIGDAGGVGGLALTGIGEGGGGLGEGIGMGAIGTYGHGNGTGFDQGFGHGSSTSRLQRGRRPKAPSVRLTGTSVSGRIPPEVIQRIVRANHGRFRACYESALRNNPSLQGRVVVSFVIGRDGRVSNVSGGGDIPDAGVISCVTRSFYGLSFPQPDGGIVTVSYPLMMTPG